MTAVREREREREGENNSLTAVVSAVNSKVPGREMLYVSALS